MRWNRIFLATIALILYLVLGGCTSKGIMNESMQSAATNITENILIGINEGDYDKFSSQFDQQMKNSISESQFKIIGANVKSKIGTYISKEYISSEKKDGYIIMIYKGKFSQEKDNVIIKTVLRDNNETIAVSGFWLDSPTLRE